MAGFSTYSAIRTAMDAQQTEHFTYRKSGPSSGFVSFIFQSYWQRAGTPPAIGSITGGVYTNEPTTITFQDRPGLKKYIAGVELGEIGYAGGARLRIPLMLFDRLVGNAFPASIGILSLPPLVLPRYASGLGVSAWLESSTPGGSGSPTIQLSSYTNSDGVTGRSGPSRIWSTGSYQLYPLPLQAGDMGVRSVESITIGGTTATGTASVLLLKPILTVVAHIEPSRKHQITTQDFLLDQFAFPRVYDGASLSFAVGTEGTVAYTPPAIYGTVRMVYG